MQGAAGYHVYLFVRSGASTYTEIADYEVGAVTSHAVTGLDAGEVYYFAVAAVNASG